MERKIFPPRVVISRLTAMRSSRRWPATGLTRASSTVFDGWRYFTRTEQRGPSPRQSRAVGTMVLMCFVLNASKYSTYFTYSHVENSVCGCETRFFDHEDSPWSDRKVGVYHYSIIENIGAVQAQHSTHHGQHRVAPVFDVARHEHLFDASKVVTRLSRFYLIK